MLTITAGLTVVERARGFLEAATLSDEATQLTEVKARGEIAIRSDLVAREYGLNSRQAGAVDHLLSERMLTLGDLERRFPEMKELKQLVRDLVAPGRDLGHSDD